MVVEEVIITTTMLKMMMFIGSRMDKQCFGVPLMTIW